jgi:hypothetical protein
MFHPSRTREARCETSGTPTRRLILPQVPPVREAQPLEKEPAGRLHPAVVTAPVLEAVAAELPQVVEALPRADVPHALLPDLCSRWGPGAGRTVAGGSQLVNVWRVDAILLSRDSASATTCNYVLPNAPAIGPNAASLKHSHALS